MQQSVKSSDNNPDPEPGCSKQTDKIVEEELEKSFEEEQEQSFW